MTPTDLPVTVVAAAPWGVSIPWMIAGLGVVASSLMFQFVRPDDDSVTKRIGQALAWGFVGYLLGRAVEYFAAGTTEAGWVFLILTASTVYGAVWGSLYRIPIERRQWRRVR